MSAAVDIGLVDDDLPDVPVLITGLALIEQLIASTVNLFLGEWYLDERVGLPIVEWVTEKAPDVPAIVARLELEVGKIPGVRRTERAVGVLEGRTIRVELVVVTDAGDTTQLSILQDTTGLRNGSPFALYFRSNRISGAA